MLDIAGIQNKIELSMSSKVNQVLGEHFTPQAGKWDGEGNLADYFKLVEESAQKATTLRRKLVVGAVSSFKKEKLAPFFPVLKDKEKGGGKWGVCNASLPWKGDGDEQEDQQDRD